MSKLLSEEDVKGLTKDQNALKSIMDSGELDKAEECLKYAYLLISLGNQYLEEAFELLEKGKLLYGKLKNKGYNFINSFDSFEPELFKFLGNDARNTILEDYDAFSRIMESMPAEKHEPNLFLKFLLSLRVKETNKPTTHGN